MDLKSFPVLLLLLILFVLCDVSTAVRGRKAATVGGWQSIGNLKAAEVQEAAQFAVTEHNKEASTNLKFQYVLRGESQVVSGINYRLVIVVGDGGAAGKYEAVVYVKPWLHFKSLTSFRKL